MFSASICINKKLFGPVNFPTLDQAETWLSRVAWHVANLPSLSFTLEEAQDGQFNYSLSFDHDTVENVYMIPEDQADLCYAYVHWMLVSGIEGNGGIEDMNVSEWRLLESGSWELVETDANALAFAAL